MITIINRLIADLRTISRKAGGMPELENEVV